MDSRFLVLFALLGLFGCSSAIQCWSGNYTRMGKNGPGYIAPQIIDCGPQVRYCFKSHVRVEYANTKNNMKPVTELRMCGDASRCTGKGCDGKSSNKVCCCDKNLCNSSPISSFLAALTLPIVYRFI